ncbi:pectate lyase-like adhesive domain-containing protein [Mesorhizobium sp. ORM16]|uniref:pectate lyase-like adhesive domain-containing protein n=1 Tax=Mesorhizobium sp. ORM16 TaxID=3376989 RepID=UPI003857A583
MDAGIASDAVYFPRRGGHDVGSVSGKCRHHHIVTSETQLKGAINNAQKRDAITFKADITLSANLPTVRSDVTINGNNHTLSGNNQYRGLFVQSGDVAINDLTIANAKARAARAATQDFIDSATPTPPAVVAAALDWAAHCSSGP